MGRWRRASVWLPPGAPLQGQELWNAIIPLEQGREPGHQKERGAVPVYSARFPIQFENLFGSPMSTGGIIAYRPAIVKAKKEARYSRWPGGDSNPELYV